MEIKIVTNNFGNRQFWIEKYTNSKLVYTCNIRSINKYMYDDDGEISQPSTLDGFDVLIKF
jgi:hypothetical protein